MLEEQAGMVVTGRYSRCLQEPCTNRHKERVSVWHLTVKGWKSFLFFFPKKESFPGFWSSRFRCSLWSFGKTWGGFEFQMNFEVALLNMYKLSSCGLGRRKTCCGATFSSMLWFHSLQLECTGLISPLWWFPAAAGRCFWTGKKKSPTREVVCDWSVGWRSLFTDWCNVWCRTS